MSTEVHICRHKTTFVYRSPHLSTEIHNCPQKSTFVHRSPNLSTKIHICPLNCTFVNRSPWKRMFNTFSTHIYVPFYTLFKGENKPSFGYLNSRSWNWIFCRNKRDIVITCLSFFPISFFWKAEKLFWTKYVKIESQ